MLDGAVVDVHAGVVARRAGLVGLTPQDEVRLGGREDHTIEVVDLLPLVCLRLDDPLERRGEGLQVVEAHVSQRDRAIARAAPRSGACTSNTFMRFRMGSGMPRVSLAVVIQITWLASMATSANSSVKL